MNMTSVRDEFRCRNLLPHYSDPTVFYISQWRWPRPVFIVYRLAVAVFAIVWILIVAVKFSPRIQYPYGAFLTNWSYFILTAHLTLAALITCLHSTNDDDQRQTEQETEPLLSGLRSEATSDDLASTTTRSVFGDSTVDGILVRVDPMPWYIKFDWILFNINALSSIFVTFVFFVFLFPHMGMGLHLPDFIVHISNSILTVLELCLCAIPVKFLHFVYPLAFLVVYVVFSAIYWSFDHTRVIYPVILDWNSPGNTVSFILGAIVGALILWTLVFCVVRLRKWIFIRVISL